jgi:hypothetical protein
VSGLSSTGGTTTTTTTTSDDDLMIIRPYVTPLDWTKPFVCPTATATTTAITTAEEKEEGKDGIIPAPSSPPCPPYDIVLLTDCVFSADLAPSLVSTICSVCDAKTEVYCCYEIRDEASVYNNYCTLLFKYNVYILYAAQ